MLSSQTHTLHTEYSRAIIYHTYRQIIQTEKKNLNETIQSSLSSLSLPSWLKRPLVHTLLISFTQTFMFPRLVDQRAPSEFAFILALVLPLGLLGDHLLHAERGQSDAEGGQQCGRSGRVPIGRLARVTGGGTGELIHLSIV